MFSESWPWFVAGPLIGLTIPILYIAKKRAFGVSSSFTHLCNISFFRKTTDRSSYLREHGWNILFITGMILSGFFFKIVIGNYGLSASPELIIGEVQNGTPFPDRFSDLSFIFSFEGFVVLMLGGFLIGFGSRYANGCTSGHAITGLASRQLSSLFAVFGFFLGGLIITYGLRGLL